MNCNDVQELIPAYALGALDDDERAAVQSHLTTGCPACSAQFAETESLLGQLPLALPTANASAQVKSRLLAKVREQRAVKTREAPPVSRPRSFARRLLGQAIAGGLVALVLLASIGAAAVYVSFDRALRAAGLEIAALKMKLARRDEQIRQLKRQAEQLEPLRDLLAAPDFRPIALAAKEPAGPNASGRVLWKGKAEWFVVLRGLRPLPAGHCYQVWYIRQAEPEPVSLATFSLAPNGEVLDRIALPAELGPLLRVVITQESDNQQQKPAGPILFISSDQSESP